MARALDKRELGGHNYVHDRTVRIKGNREVDRSFQADQRSRRLPGSEVGCGN